MALRSRRRVGPADALAAGAIAVLAIEPLAPLSVGFWLSFGAVAAILLAVTKVDVDEIPKTATLRAGVVAVIGIFGLAWLGDSFIAAHKDVIVPAIGQWAEAAPWTFAFGLFFASVLLYSQAATTRALMPLGMALGIPPQFLIAMFPSVNGYFFIPTYGSLIAAINFDLSGTTRIGKYVLNHSFMIPGLVATSVSVFTGLLIAKGRVDAKIPVTQLTLLGIDVDTGAATRYRDALGNLVSDVAFYEMVQVPPLPAGLTARLRGLYDDMRACIAHAERECRAEMDGGLAKLLPVYSVFFMILTLASIGLPTTSGFTGEFMVLMGAFNAAWPQFQAGNSLPLVLAVSAVAGVVLGALYMLWLAQRLLFGAVKAPHQPFTDLVAREKAILLAFVVAIFALGLFPQGPLAKTELAARDYQQRVLASRVEGTTP